MFGAFISGYSLVWVWFTRHTYIYSPAKELAISVWIFGVVRTSMEAWRQTSLALDHQRVVSNVRSLSKGLTDSYD